MYINIYPNTSEWNTLTQRPYKDNSLVSERVKEIINSVKQNGDSAILRLTKALDAPSLERITVGLDEIEFSKTRVSVDLKNAILLAKENITTFHTSQIKSEPKTETSAGVTCWRKSVAIQKIGLYIPGGSAPLFSTILMLGIPAQLGGCEDIIICTPPDKQGNIDPAILFTADLLGIKTIYKVGGAQAIAAMSLGTESITKVDKIFGPGNQYVTEAKSQIQSLGVAIDMPAGPSELLIIADSNATSSFVAADLLSQAEHGPDSQVILVTDQEEKAKQILAEVTIQLSELPRKSIAEKSIANSRIIILKDIESCIQFSNVYAPEHLILALDNAETYSEKIINAGSVFLGRYSCESAGDYASGTNHTLPTNGYAKSYSGVSVDSFVKKITFQNITKKGIQNIGPSIELMAAAEGLDAHKNAVTIRLNTIDNER